MDEGRNIQPLQKCKWPNLPSNTYATKLLTPIYRKGNSHILPYCRLVKEGEVFLQTKNF